MSNPSHILSLKLIEVYEDLTYEEKLVKTLDKHNKVLRTEDNTFGKGLVKKNHKIEEATLKV